MRPMRIIRKFLPVLVAGLLAVPAAAQETEQSFLEGFPDVPILAGVRGIDGESVFFDTPSGIIAEVKLLIEGDGEQVMNTYAQALAGLGWVCEKKPQSLRCGRDKTRLIFFDTDPTVKNGRLILRLEPIK